MTDKTENTIEVIVRGKAGVGKTTVATMIAKMLGDDFSIRLEDDDPPIDDVTLTRRLQNWKRPQIVIKTRQTGRLASERLEDGEGKVPPA